jgi:hypothetical protein
MTPIEDSTLDVRPILNKAARAQQSLIVGLKGIQKPSGGWPTIYPFDSTTHHWTTSQCFRALVESQERPVYYREALDSLLAARKGQVWKRGMADGLPYDSIYCTSDAIMSFLSVQQSDVTKKPLELMARARNRDHGWGFIVGDETSRVRATAWAIDAFLMAQHDPSLTAMVEHTLSRTQTFAEWLKESVAWLDQSRAIAGGWGYSANDAQGNMSATAVTLRTLLSARNNGFALNRKNVTDGLSLLKKCVEEKRWVGAYETFDVYLQDKFVGRHRAYGDGVPMVLMALTDAAKQEFLFILDEHTESTINWIVGACKPYGNLPGKWLVPSSDGGMKPLVWDSAYAILALNNFRQCLLDMIRKRKRLRTPISEKKVQPPDEHEKSTYT